MPTAARLQITNNSLKLLGERTITSPSESSKEADTADILWDEAISEILVEHDWMCASVRAGLMQSALANLSEYGYVYELPADAVAIRALLDPNNSYAEIPVPVGVEVWKHEGKLMYCDYNPVAVRYTGIPTDVIYLSAWVRSQLIYLLASKMAYALTKDAQLQDKFYMLYQARMNHAKGLDNKARKARPQASQYSFAASEA
jgi:hypothetical protein